MASASIYALWSLLLCFLRATHSYEAFSTYTSNLPPTSHIENTLPFEECNYTLYVFFPYVENYTLFNTDGEILALPYTKCFNDTLETNNTILVSHDYGNYPFDVYSYIIDTEFCSAVNNSSNIYLPVICAYEANDTIIYQVTITFAPIVVTLTITSISILFSVFMILTYSLFKKLRTLPGQTVLNLAVAFLASDMMIIVFTSYVYAGNNPDPRLYIVEMMFFYARFMWMAIVGFEISRHIYNGMNLHFDSTSKKNKILLTYLIIGWGTPVIIGIITASVEFSGIEDNHKVKLFGANGMVITFLPLGLILLFNSCIAIILLVALRMAAKRRNKFGGSAKKGAVNFSRVYLIIMTALGLTWFSVFLLLAVGRGTYILQYFFPVLNSTQPIFVCIAFLGTRKIALRYKALLLCLSEEDIATSSASSFPPIHRRARRLLSVMMSDLDFAKKRRDSTTSQNSRPASSLTYLSRLSLSRESSLGQSFDGTSNTRASTSDLVYCDGGSAVCDNEIQCNSLSKRNGNVLVSDNSVITTIHEEMEPSEVDNESDTTPPSIEP